MTYSTIEYDVPIPHVARITLNRPDSLNALNLPLVEEVYNAAHNAATDDDISVLVYRGAGRAFCVGRDFKYSAELQAADSAGSSTWRERFRSFGPETWTHPKVTIAQVHGYALGGGHNLAVGCDITIAAKGTKFGYPEARWGIFAGDNHVWNWLIGPKRTKEYLLTGRNFDADQAYEFGLINHVVPLEELESSVLSLAADLALMEERHPGFLYVNKMAINQRHHELTSLTLMNPQEVQISTRRTRFIASQEASQHAFFDNVEGAGVGGALKSMHEGFSSDR